MRSSPVAAMLVVLAPAALAQDTKPPEEPKKAPEEPKKSSWLLADEEEAPDPPIVKAEAGVIAWPYLRTEILLGRKGGRHGQTIDDAEDQLDLADRWASPFVLATAGTTIRGGLYALDLDRQGFLRPTSTTVDLGGDRVLARPGDLAQCAVHYSQLDLYAQWDVLYGARYRLTVLGGARFIKISTRIEGIETQPVDLQSVSVSDVLASPILGGEVDLIPISFLTVYVNIRFIDWAWKDIHLREQRTFEMRFGVKVDVYEDMLSFALDFRFINMFVNATDLTGGNFAQIEIEAGGLGFSVVFQY
jgi:hypothetical protein